MTTLHYIFLISCFLIFYNYAGYAIIAYCWGRLFPPGKKKGSAGTTTPSVSFIVAAYNEEDVIREKINNCLGLDYPSNLIEYIFITDGCTDQTASIAASEPGIQHMHLPERNGKIAAMHRAAAAAKNDILIFSDANTHLNREAVRLIARHYADPRTGGVAGEKKVTHPGESEHEVGAGEGMYWRYESVLKKIDSDLYTVVGAAGELFSIRKDLFHPVKQQIILDDFVSTLKVAQKGYRIIYEPGACATETPSFSLSDEKKRKVRIAAGGFQAMVLLVSLFYFWKHPRLSFLYISHRVLRWTLSPLCLPVAFVSNLVLCFTTETWLFRILFVLQCIFYFLAFLPGGSNRPRLQKIPHYFVFMNLSVYAGFFRFIKGNQSVNWEKAKRAAASSPYPAEKVMNYE